LSDLIALFPQLDYRDQIGGKRLAKLAGELRAWARIGAEKRLVEIAEEAAAIHRAFPELRNRREVPSRTLGRKSNADGADATASATPARRRRRLSAAGRAKLRASLKKRWAAAKKAGKNRLS